MGNVELKKKESNYYYLKDRLASASNSIRSLDFWLLLPQTSFHCCAISLNSWVALGSAFLCQLSNLLRKCCIKHRNYWRWSFFGEDLCQDICTVFAAAWRS